LTELKLQRQLTNPFQTTQKEEEEEEEEEEEMYMDGSFNIGMRMQLKVPGKP